VGERAAEFERAVTAVGKLIFRASLKPGPLVICSLSSAEVIAEALSGLGGLAPNAAVIAASTELPAFVDERAVVAVIGRRGEPAPHTLAAAALETGARVIGVVEAGSSPQLESVLGSTSIAEIEAGGDGLSLASIVGSLTQVSVGGPLTKGPGTYVSTPPPGSIAAARPEGQNEDLADVIAQIERRESSDAEAREIARRIGRTFPYWLGTTGVGAAAAEVARQEVNLRLKTPAFAGRLPQATYIDVAGFGLDGDVTRQIVTLIHLATPDEPPIVTDRVAAAVEILRETVADILTVTAHGVGRLSWFCDLAVFGEQVARAAAAAEGLDPGPVPVLDDITRAIGLIPH
jgi:hypothetical protein